MGWGVRRGGLPICFRTDHSSWYGRKGTKQRRCLRQCNQAGVHPSPDSLVLRQRVAEKLEVESKAFRAHRFRRSVRHCRAKPQETASITEVLSPKASKPHPMCMLNRCFWHEYSFISYVLPTMAKVIILSGDEGLVKPAQLQKALTRYSEVTGVEESDFGAAALVIFVDICYDQLRRSGKGILRQPIRNPPPDQAVRHPRKLCIKLRKPSGIWRAVVICESKVLPLGYARTGVAGRGRPPVCLPNQLDSKVLAVRNHSAFQSAGAPVVHHNDFECVSGIVQAFYC